MKASKYWKQRAEDAEARIVELEATQRHATKEEWDALEDDARRMFDEIQELRRHHGDIPTVERIKQVHSGLNVSWLEHTAVGEKHRTYYQSADEACFICTIMYGLEVAKEQTKYWRNLYIEDICPSEQELLELDKGDNGNN